MVIEVSSDGKLAIKERLMGAKARAVIFAHTIRKGLKHLRRLRPRHTSQLRFGRRECPTRVKWTRAEASRLEEDTRNDWGRKRRGWVSVSASQFLGDEA